MKKVLTMLYIAGAVALTAAGATEIQKSSSPSPLRSARVIPNSDSRSFSPDRQRPASRATGISIQSKSARISPSPMRLTAYSPSLPQINGVVVWASNWGYNPKAGLYSLPAANRGFDMLVDGPNGATQVVGDRVYTINHVYLPELEINYPRYTVYDLDSGQELYYCNYNNGSPDWSILPIDMDADPLTGQVYAITYNHDMTGCQLSKLNFSDTDVRSTKIADLEGSWNSMAFAADGTLYAISKVNEKQNGYLVCTESMLNTLNRETGAVTEIGPTGLAPEYATSAAIDRESGRMFWTVSPAEEAGYLAEVNTATGAATILQYFDHAEEVVGLYVPPRLAEDKAPAAPSSMEAEFPAGSLSGKVSFTAPAKLYDGTVASGSLTYEITANGEIVATGTTSCGSRVEKNVTLPLSGDYKIGASVSNAVGRGPQTFVSLYVGNGVPQTTYARLSYSGGRMNLAWDAVTETVDGGYIDPSQVTYTVRRYPEGTVMSASQNTTNFSEEVEVPDTYTVYYYGVTAEYAGMTSAESLSNRVALGEIVPPLHATFDSEEDMAGWTIIDANNDHRRWMWSTLQNLRISFSSENSMDDWVITPALHLEAGRAYPMSFEAYCDDASYAERMEVMLGTEPTAQSMTTAVVTPVEIKTTDPMKVTGVITPAVTGTYFVGFHGISDADCFMLNLDNINIEAGLDSGAPSAATALTAVPDPSGDYRATVSFRTPTTTIAGGAIWQTFRRVEVWRDDELVKLFTTAGPGDELSFTDTMDAAGTYTYTIYCYNTFGQGLPASVSVFVGTGIPLKPASASIVETANEGEVTVSWTPVTTDVHGNTVNQSKITYTIGENSAKGWRSLYSGLTGTSHTFRAVEGVQDFVQYAVFAETEGGISEGTLTDLIPVGPPFPGLTESFADGEVSSIWGSRTIQNGQFGLFDDQSGITSQDGDNGFMGMAGENYGDCAALFSGKVTLAGMENPCLSFYTFNLADDDLNEIAVGVRVAGTDEFITLRTVAVHQVANAENWGKVTVSLAPFEGKTVQIQFLCTIKAYNFILLDNIKVASMADYDLAAEAISAPLQVKTGTDYTVSVTVSNDGSKSATAYSVDLFANDTKVETRQCGALSSGAKTKVEFARTMPAFDAKATDYYAVVNYSADSKTDNNRTATVCVSPRTSNLPAPKNLAAAAEGEGVKLTWDAPDLDSMKPEEMTESFEEGVAFAHSFDGWTFIDRDQAPLGGFQNSDGSNVHIPGLTTGVTTGSFFVFDGSYSGFTEGYAAHSGDKYLASLFRYDDGMTDDWAISPELSGASQTITFMARSFASRYLEKIQVLYSTGSLNPDDFQPLCELTTVPAEWTLFSAKLPAGAKRFALRSSSEGSFMLMIDDVTFTPLVSTVELNLSGYNVYRDGVKINNAPLINTRHFDATGLPDHKYVTTAIYQGVGESGASNVVSLTGVNQETLHCSVSVRAGVITVSGTEGVTVKITDTKGVVLHRAEGDTHYAAMPGVYIVGIGHARTEKVVVK